MAVSVVRALPLTLLRTTINVLCTILKNSITLALTRCPWTWPTSFKAWKPSKDWSSRFESPTYSVGSSTDPQICINRFTHIEKSVPNLNHYSRSYIQKTQKENKPWNQDSWRQKTEKNTKVSWTNEARILTDLWKLDCKYPNEKILHYPVEIFLSDRRTL